ncbi:hypothetical protein OG689_11085 [Kitasatospora sp. NBC_00240]|uniref:hypothetical protein n=1 Tax=Kitasatospora sp. NBC_00240 TaxID=2903567 RepID=UPI002251B682|nr:hypothetical protein [Kitasatospora sp. NBC_00240]MCX5209829.1 hypothetical protein [Kitasatospora sp. NBC_00240]
MDELAGLGMIQGGAVGVVTLIVLLILTGRLVPRRTYEDMREERDTWRAAHQVSEEARHVAQDQNGELLEVARVAVPLLRALPNPQPPAEGVQHAPVDQGLASQA